MLLLPSSFYCSLIGLALAIANSASAAITNEASAYPQTRVAAAELHDDAERKNRLMASL